MTPSLGATAASEAEALSAARDRFYPDWWMFDDPSLPVGQRPVYRVVCRNPEEVELAYRVRPDYIDATIVLDESSLAVAA